VLTRRQVTGGLLAGAALGAVPAAAFGFAEGAGAAGRRGMVASREALATGVGVEALEAGGNAVDAAVAVAFALAVTLPQAGNLGGGGFALVHRRSGGTAALDFRETAPGRAHRDLFLDAGGAVNATRARYSHDSVGVPGSVAGYLDLLERFGSWSRERVIAPAIRLAEEGVDVTPILSANIERRMQRFQPWPATMAVIARADGRALQPGDRLRQPDLADSLRLIARDGHRAFYDGPIGELIAAEMARHGGAMTAGDIAAYRTVWREPVFGSYRGYRVASMPPPSSGGAHLIQMLNILEGWDIAGLGHNSVAGLHLLAETMRRAYADRAVHLGDPDFHDVPLAWLASKDYGGQLRRGIDPDRATPSSEVSAGTPGVEGADTTHLSVIDGAGDTVSMTTTLNFGFGTGIVAEGTGIFLNNEMDDFSAKPGVANAYGLVGGEANAIAPGKRPLSSMTPTIVLGDEDQVLVTGSPGGSRIITTVLQMVSNLVDHGLTLDQATTAPRIHHQWLPDRLRVENGIPHERLDALAAMGHTIETGAVNGAAQSVLRTGGGDYGSTDPRRPGGLAAGPKA